MRIEVNLPQGNTLIESSSVLVQAILGKVVFTDVERGSQSWCRQEEIGGGLQILKL